ncbi:UNVERIFIED_CONTAM: multiple sugar transport system permease protein [Murimonas intestini]|uniref:Multiple sugar transport system permease protein n=3 Tax=Murimonas intestini TaxID=1337051 RepID=A0AB73T644_9FIRM|nr:sugar ABC transporter permease [Murimonas intestini]
MSGLRTHVFASRKKGRMKKVNYDKYGWYFILPFIIVFLVFSLYPILYSLQISFTDLKNFSKGFSYVGFGNYIDTLKLPFFWTAMRNTFLLFIIFFIPQIIISLLLAYWFTTISFKVRGQSFFKFSIYLPCIITPVSIGMLFGLFFEYPRGPINTLLQSLSVISEPVNFMKNMDLTRGIIAFVQCWVGYGPMMIMFIGAILGINPELLESARIDGCTGRQSFFRIVIPLIKPILLYNIICSTIGGLQIFDIPRIINGGGPRNSTLTMSMLVYNQAFSGSGLYGNAAAESYLMTILMAAISVVLYFILREKDDEVTYKRRNKR